MKTNFLTSARTIFISALTITGLFLISCENSETVNPEIEYADLIDESYTSEVYDEIEDLGDEAVDFLDNSATFKSVSDIEWRYNRLSPCAIVTRIYEDDLVSITIDFGEENCLCNDGRERRGKIYINHYGYYWEGDVEIEYSFDNYFVDDNQLTGTKNVLRTTNEDGNRQSDIIVDGALILSNDEGTITWYAERTREFIEGSDTRDKSDDVIEITGFSNGVLADGTEISSEIISPLVRINEIGCYRYFVSGIRKIIKGEEPEITIDYGDGTCDNLAEVTQDGITTIIEITRNKISIN
ncbi:MAG: hypothetical protein KOO66_13570 [Bacteroidales bacterium]|nr:hypothetical protein [Bacteroidales bacterium]